MKSYVLDSSALLAWLWQEPGAQRVEHLLGDEICLLSAVNAAEVVTKAIERGLPPEHARELLVSMDLRIVPFDEDAAIETGLLRTPTRHLGLSLGDRACLALAKSLGAVAVTADRPWLELSLGIEIEIECVRPG